ncbi:M48 family metallopeptidase [Candidatus Gottesmanbacteria bacterium]|nr:M48 family metallopeptidase [Candidatus Gottesmanbacteria bacterium]
MLNIYEQVDANKRKSWLIMVLFVFFITAMVYLFAKALDFGAGWIGMALIFSGLASLGSFYYGDKVILGLSGARPADKKKNFMFFTVCENLCLVAQLPMPKLYVIDDSAPNAFATGRDPEHAVVCATTGLLSKLTRTELEGVIGHELSHVRNYDTRLMAIVAILIGIVALLSDWFMRSLWWGNRDEREDRSGLQGIVFIVAILAALFSPIIGQLIQLAISRRREFLADSGSVMLTRQPSGLINALKKIASDEEPLEAANKATAHLYFCNPFKDKGHEFVGWFSHLFDTHPPISDRIKALEQTA